MLLSNLNLYLHTEKVTEEEKKFLILLNSADKTTKFIYVGERVSLGDEYLKLTDKISYDNLHNYLHTHETKELSKFKYKFKQTPWHNDIIGIVEETTNIIYTISLIRLSDILNCYEENTDKKTRELAACNLRHEFFDHLWESGYFIVLQLKFYQNENIRFSPVMNHFNMRFDKSKWYNFKGDVLYKLTELEKNQTTPLLDNYNVIEPWTGSITYCSEELQYVFYIKPGELQEYYLKFLTTFCKRNAISEIVYINKKAIDEDNIKVLNEHEYNSRETRKHTMKFWYAGDDTIADDLIGVTDYSKNDCNNCYFITLQEFAELIRFSQKYTHPNLAQIKASLLSYCWDDKSFILTDEATWNANSEVTSVTSSNCTIDKKFYNFLGIELDDITKHYNSISEKFTPTCMDLINKHNQHNNSPIEKSNLFQS